MGYLYQKWFFDFLTDRGDYLLFFLSTVRILGRRVSSLSYRVRPNAKAIVSRTIPLPSSFRAGEDGDIDYGDREWSFGAAEKGGFLRFQDDRLRVRLEYPASGSMSFDPGLTVRRGKDGFLRWRPLYLTGVVKGEISRDGEKWDLEHGSGYIDYVSSNILPFAVPARRVMWGRAAKDDFRFTYTFIAGRHKNWGKAYASIGEEKTAVLVGLTSDPGNAEQFPDRVSLRGAAGGIDLAIEVNNRATVVTDRFMEDVHVRPRFVNRILAGIARNPRGQKYLADFVIRLDRRGAAAAVVLPGINECAVFD